MMNFFKELEWFQLVCLISWTIFIVQGTLSLIFGDLDIDLDFDGEVDFDGGDLFSPKGILYFITGGSTYLSARFASGALTVYSYIIAFVFGVVFMVVLIFLYKWISRKIASQESKTLSRKDLVGLRGTIVRVAYDERPYHYSIRVKGYYIEAVGDDVHYFGEEVLIKDFIDNIYTI